MQSEVEVAGNTKTTIKDHSTTNQFRKKNKISETFLKKAWSQMVSVDI